MNYNFGGIKNNNDNYTIGYTELIAPMIKAIQELTIKNKDLSEQAKELSEQNKELYNYNLKLDERINKLEKK